MGQSYELVRNCLAQLEEIRAKAEKIVVQGRCFSLKDLAVNGQDVIVAGVAPGPEVGRVMESLLEQALNGSVQNSKESLI